MRSQLKSILINATIFGSLLFLLMACSKQRIELNQYESPDDFMYDNRPPEQEFVLNGDSGGPIVGNQGTRLWMDSSLFMYPNGNDVNYPIVIKLIELYQPKDMMLYEMPTVAQSNLLVTAGEIRVRAFKDNQELVLKPNKVYFTQMPDPTPDPQMSVFYGNDIGNDIIDWEDNASAVSNNQGINALETVSIDTSGAYYNMTIPVMGWINADYFYNYPSGTTQLSFTSNDDDLTNVVKFLYFDNIESVMQVYGETSGNVPVGASVKVLCFAMGSSGNMYNYYEEATITANHTINVTLTQTTEADLIALMETF